MDYYFISNTFKAEIKTNVIDSIFPNLNSYHQNILLTYLLDIIDVIAIKFNFDMNKKVIYEYQFKQNNYRDTMGLLYCLLPYIDDTSNIKKKALRSLNELYVKKKENSPIDINKNEPLYEYTNLQYGRCKRIRSGNKILAEEIQFSEDHLKHNYILLLDTIKTIANKLYVNWINIRPVDKYTATDGSLLSFVHTNNAALSRKIESWDPTKKDGRLYKGLDAGEIYNIFSNYLYHNIKNIKWIIYELKIDNKEYKLVYILNKLLNIEDCVKNIPWNFLPENKRDSFITQWKQLINMTIHNGSYENITTSKIWYIMKRLMIFFNRGYKNIHVAKNNGYIDISGDDNIDDDDNDDNDDISINDKIKTSIKSLEKLPEHIYEYIKDVFFELRGTWYAQFYINFNKDDNMYNLDNSETPKATIDDKFTVKNVYNYAKSLVHYIDTNESDRSKQYKEFPKLWNSLTDDDKTTIIKRINMNTTNYKEILEWFNITRYLKNLMELEISQVIVQNVSINNRIQKNIATISFDVLATLGLLSEFVPDKSITDYSMLPSETNERNKAIHQKVKSNVIKNYQLEKRWKESIYFINNMKFGDININYKGRDGKPDKLNYLDALCDFNYNASGWIHTYAMDWISQIGFFHHYLNNRIIYITGGTGVGKSTQTPKLLLYALKMIDYKTTGKIACTQPRIPPTKQNANTIANQMGIPIEQYNSSIGDLMKHNNYYIQYKTKEKKHDIKQNILTLKIMTDGTLINELRNPLLKKLSGENYKDENIYDIVIVDEAHEHNHNMDLILTRMKYVSYYNNDIKLVIISATMEEDEPVYRRYYRDINDNKMYPLNTFIEKYNLDRINVDRRIHISPPGETTQYKIDDIYIPKTDPVMIVKKILDTTGDGDILLFQPGMKEIKDSITQLNQITSSNIIALPYYSQLNSYKRELIENVLLKDKNKITIPKNQDFDVEYDETKIQKVPPGTYKRVVLVATNIAEASITIDSLKYVVDTGTQKTNVYDFNSRNDTLKATYISESSRLQRRGRVGRVGPGSVYYIYEKGTMEKNRRQFNISILDISDIMFGMLKDNNDNITFFTNQNDPNTQEINSNILLNDYKFNLDRIIKNKYFIKDQFYKYYGNVTQYDYENNIPPHTYYKTGFDKETIDDEYGSFYIVHPNELCFRRNILGTITTIENKCEVIQEQDRFISKKMVTFWDILRENLFIVFDGDNVIKTEFGKRVITIKESFTILTQNHILSFIYSRIHSCQDDMIKLIAMHLVLNTVKDIIFDTIDNGKYKMSFTEAKNLYGNKYGDSYSLIKIADSIIHFFTTIFPTLIKTTPQSIDDIIKNRKTSTITVELEKQKKLFIDGVNNNNFKLVNKNILNDMLHLYNTNKLVFSSQLSQDELNNLTLNNIYTKSYIEKIKSIEYVPIIREWCKEKLLKYENVIRFYDYYIYLLDEMYKYDNKLNDQDPEIDKIKDEDFSWFDTHTPYTVNTLTASKHKRLQISLMHGYSYNIAKSIAVIDNNYYYLNVMNPNINYVYKVAKLFKPKIDLGYTIENNTFLNKMGLTILYIKKKEDENTGDDDVHFIEIIDDTLISKIIPHTLIDYKKYNIPLHQKYITTFLNSLTINNNNNQNYIAFTNNYINTINNIKMLLLNNYDKNALETLTVVDDNQDIKHAILNQHTLFKNQFGGSVLIENIYKNNTFICSLVNELNKNRH
ncbi:HrpA-like RNA helicase [Fadolivirus algeromassiliense]|jgi:hypothetical protein|uniref:RNA helicase n=1 Tax=Fadolivirus FV1/VV64 TaxID=3070911 RepID=A0A7D3V5A6_9VIRU|nr:HrpA-like RNA helicase [Fadolivirus algeromassiliense]QKF93775.1 HrpA-like RNA helicase [Fadolivirus FV1/VV64]